MKIYIYYRKKITSKVSILKAVSWAWSCPKISIIVRRIIIGTPCVKQIEHISKPFLIFVSLLKGVAAFPDKNPISIPHKYITRVAKLVTIEMRTPDSGKIYSTQTTMPSSTLLASSNSKHLYPYETFFWFELSRKVSLPY